MTPRTLGLWGAALTLLVVAASVLLRLGTSLDAGGHATSLLAPALENAVRLGHRLAATGVALLAVAAFVLVVRAHPGWRERIHAVVAIILLTVLLAAIGWVTPGYRLVGVTVANVVAGVTLACAFWWLRAPAAAGTRGAGAAFAAAALLAVVVQVASGAFTSALAMHGLRSFEPLHVALGPVVAALAIVAAARNAGRRRTAAWCVAALGIAQLVLGMWLAAEETRSIPAGGSHALLAALLAVSLVALRASAPGSTAASAAKASSTTARSATPTPRSTRAIA